MPDPSTCKNYMHNVIFRKLILSLIKNLKYKSKEIFIFPTNIGNMHWTVIIFDAKSNYYLHLDPMRDHSFESATLSKLMEVMKNQKFANLSATSKKMKNAKQKDGWSCGVIILMVIYLQETL